MNAMHRIVLGALVAGSAWAPCGRAQAGNLDSPAAPDSTASAMFTLEDLYRKLDNPSNAVAPRGGAFAEPAEGPTNPSLHSLNDLMTLVTNRAPVPRTGQTTSYATGDDGATRYGVPWPSPRFALAATNGPGTNAVLDRLTGLMWTRHGDLADAVTGWTNAIQFCENLDYGGYTDWRLPNLLELQRTADYGSYAPALAPGHPFHSFFASDYAVYWTSSTSDGAWIRHYNPRTGKANVGVISATTGSGHVWPVRGGRK